jgi:hypothetical protein
MGSSSTTYQIPWPQFMLDLMALFRVALLDVFQITAVDCYASYNYYFPFWFVGFFGFLLFDLWWVFFFLVLL